MCLLDYFRFLFRERTIMSSVRLLLRVRAWAGLPQGVLGWPPIGALPSPPPCGWSRGFITEPRTVGRRPLWRFGPPLPPTEFLCSAVAPPPGRAPPRLGAPPTPPPGRRRRA